MSKKIAIISGVTGQDGSYLSELLIKKKYIVHGLLRRASSLNIGRIQHLIDKYSKKGIFNLHYVDMIDTGSISSVIRKYKPDEFYNLAAMSHVGISFTTSEATLNINAIAPMRILESIKLYAPKCKFYQASSSEMFGDTPPPQNEKTLFNPQSPYGISKVSAYHSTRFFRHAYKIFAVNGILFNHESPRRGLNFVTRKITHTIARILVGEEDKLYLGDISTRRDWGHAKDYVEAMWKMMQQKKPDDYVVATEANHSIEDFLDYCLKIVGLNKKKFVVTNYKKFLRPSEVPDLRGDSSKAKKILKWRPKYNLKRLCDDMIKSDLKLYGLNIKKAKEISKKLNRNK